MLKCWNEEPSKRPIFEDLSIQFAQLIKNNSHDNKSTSTISQLMEKLSGKEKIIQDQNLEIEQKTKELSDLQLKLEVKIYFVKY